MPSNCSWIIIPGGCLQVAYWCIILLLHTFHVLVAYRTPHTHLETWRRKSTIWVSWCLCAFLFRAFSVLPGSHTGMWQCPVVVFPTKRVEVPGLDVVHSLKRSWMHREQFQSWEGHHSMEVFGRNDSKWVAFRCILRSLFESDLLCCQEIPRPYSRKQFSLVLHPSDILALGIRVVKSFATSPPHCLS